VITGLLGTRVGLANSPQARYAELHDTPHFVYHDLSTGQLGYTRRVDGVFKLVVAAKADGDISNTGLCSSIAFTETFGSFHIAYIEEFPSDDPARSSRTKVWINQIIDPFEGKLGIADILEEGHFNVVRPTSITSEPWLYCLTYADSTNDTLTHGT
jgi:hypothetical protein